MYNQILISDNYPLSDKLSFKRDKVIPPTPLFAKLAFSIHQYLYNQIPRDKTSPVSNCAAPYLHHYVTHIVTHCVTFCVVFIHMTFPRFFFGLHTQLIVWFVLVPRASWKFHSLLNGLFFYSHLFWMVWHWKPAIDRVFSSHSHHSVGGHCPYLPLHSVSWVQVVQYSTYAACKQALCLPSPNPPKRELTDRLHRKIQP